MYHYNVKDGTLVTTLLTFEVQDCYIAISNDGLCLIMFYSYNECITV